MEDFIGFVKTSHSENAKDTCQKKGREPPKVTLDYIKKDLCFYLKYSIYTKQTEEEIEKKYSIEKDDTGFWPTDDIKRAWGKTQRMEKTLTRRKLWSLVIMLQIIQRKDDSAYDESTETQSITTVDLTMSPSHDFSEERRDQLPPNRTWPFTRALTVKKGGKKTTLDKRGRAPPKMNLKELGQNLSFYVSQNTDLIKAKKAIEKKYEIKKLENDLWPFTDIQQAWGKTQRMINKNQKDVWTTVIMSQVIKTYDNRFKDNGSMVQTKSRQWFQSTDELNKTYTTHARDQQEWQPEEDSSELNDNIEDITGPVKRTYNVREKSGDSNTNPMCSPKMRQYLSCPDRETTCIRIPLSIINAESVADEQSVSLSEERNTTSVEYKLIDRVPSLVQTMRKTSYVVQYNNQTRNPAWVFEILNKETLTNIRDKNKYRFRNDVMIQDCYKTSTKSYGEDYDRGHMAAAANHVWSKKAKKDTYLLTNIAPQDHNLNWGKWRILEEYCRKHIDDAKCKNVYVYTGPLYCPIKQRELQYNIIGLKTVPTHFFKVIIIEKDDWTRTVECYVMPNEKITPSSVGDISTSVGDISTSVGDISTSVGDISTSVGDISTSEGDISTSVGDISTSEGDISTSVGDISTSEGDIRKELLPFKKDLKFIEEVSGLQFQEKIPDSSYRETTVDVKWSAREKNRHASAKLEIFTHPVKH